MPLSEEITTLTGEKVDRIVVPKGMRVRIPIATVNHMASIWGPDSKEFVPERWIDEVGLTEKAKEIHGFSHLLSFIDGARSCLGKVFAITEFKVRGRKLFDALSNSSCLPFSSVTGQCLGRPVCSHSELSICTPGWGRYTS